MTSTAAVTETPETGSRYTLPPSADTLTAKGSTFIDNWAEHASEYTLLAVEHPDMAIRLHAKQLVRTPTVPVLLVTVLAEANTELFLATAGRVMLAYRHRYLDLFACLAHLHPETALRVGGEFMLAAGGDLLPLYEDLEQAAPLAAFTHVGDLMLAHGYHTDRFARLAALYPEQAVKDYGSPLIASWDRYSDVFLRLAATLPDLIHDSLWRVLSTGPQPAQDYYRILTHYGFTPH